MLQKADPHPRGHHAKKVGPEPTSSPPYEFTANPFVRPGVHVQMAAVYIPAKGESDGEDGSDGGSGGGDKVDRRRRRRHRSWHRRRRRCGRQRWRRRRRRQCLRARFTLNVRGGDSVASDVGQHSAICAARRRATIGQVSQTRVCQVVSLPPSRPTYNTAAWVRVRAAFGDG